MGEDRPPLVMLAGMNCSAALWSPLDLGPTLTPVLDENSLERQVVRLLDELPERFVLAGLSLGGIVAMAVARTAPERVGGLALLSTNPYGPTDQQRASWRSLRAQLASGSSPRDLQQQLLPQLLSAEVIRNRPDLVELALKMADDIGANALDHQLRLQLTRIDERPGLSRLRCPTVVVAARDDALCGVDRHEVIHQLVPGSRLVVVERCAHLSPLEQPGEVGAALRQWYEMSVPPTDL